MTPHIILDLDNCIADDAWRIPRIRWDLRDPMRRYHDYHSVAAWDRVGNEDLLTWVRAGDVRAIILTARPVLYRPGTEEWLLRNSIPHAHLIMRPDDDHRPSLELKRMQLAWVTELYGVPRAAILGAYDDRADVVAMYAAAGIPATVRAIHGVCAYTPPKKELA